MLRYAAFLTPVMMGEQLASRRAFCSSHMKRAVCALLTSAATARIAVTLQVGTQHGVSLGHG